LFPISRKLYFYIIADFREQAPISSRLNAVDLYLVVCIFFVFGKSCVSLRSVCLNPIFLSAALLEYAVILLMLKKRRKPRRTIDEGLKNLFSQNNVNNANDSGHSGGRRKQPVSEARLRQIAAERVGWRASDGF
jgi:hypothetical protein